MNLIDSSAELLAVFESGSFDMEKWKRYMDAAVPDAKELCLADLEECIRAGYSWEKDYLPVLNAVFLNAEKRNEAVCSFYTVTKDLDQKIIHRFGKTLDVDMILYLGLCNGAGWVTPIKGRASILLGIEKIMELDWCGIDAMNGLILHELGHVYQAQYGVLDREFALSSDQFLWQLFTEGIAMVFEQELLADPDYFHQDKDGWKVWCDEHFELLKSSFCSDLGLMSHENQRYFGDWVRFEGQPDVGYYLGARFVRFLLQSDCFDQLISYGIEQVRHGFARFMAAER